jgi:phosphoadenosine phosphosulfate reductase
VVKPGEDPRAGRWRGWDKTECGIHTPIADGDPNQPSF